LNLCGSNRVGCKFGLETTIMILCSYGFNDVPANHTTWPSKKNYTLKQNRQNNSTCN